MKPLRLYVLVADGAQARFLNYVDRKAGASTIDDQVFRSHAEPSRSIGSDKPGRTFDSKGHGRHTIEPRVDLHDEKEKQFLAGIVRKLEEVFHNHAFDDLFVIAAPRALGVIRHLLSTPLQQRVIGEISGDYTRYNDRDISRLVTEALPSELKVRA